MRVLIIEDNAIQALALEMMVKRLGFERVEKVYSAEQAYELVENFQPDLMLVDINLGSEITGIDIVKEVQNKFSVNVLYITGNSDIRHKEIADETDFIGYLIKPIDPDKLKQTFIEKEIIS